MCREPACILGSWCPVHQHDNPPCVTGRLPAERPAPHRSVLRHRHSLASSAIPSKIWWMAEMLPFRLVVERPCHQILPRPCAAIGPIAWCRPHINPAAPPPPGAGEETTPEVHQGHPVLCYITLTNALGPLYLNSGSRRKARVHRLQALPSDLGGNGGPCVGPARSAAAGGELVHEAHVPRIALKDCLLTMRVPWRRAGSCGRWGRGPSQQPVGKTQGKAGGQAWSGGQPAMALRARECWALTARDGARWAELACPAHSHLRAAGPDPPAGPEHHAPAQRDGPG